MRALPALVALLLLVPVAAAKGVTLHAGTRADGSMYIEPASVAVRQGEVVDLTLVNDDASTPHDWALLSFGDRDIEVYTKGGETKTIRFTADTAGTFRVVCQVVGHKQRGMEGTFVVEEKGIPAPGLAAALVAVALAVALRRR